MATVTYDQATRIYPGGDKPAVDKLNIGIEDGEFLVLVGPSGCGKSTSLRMLAGLEDVNEGAIRIGDRDVTHLPPKDRDIAMVFQNYALYPHMTVADNMGFALKIAGVNKSEIRKKVEDAAKILDLTDYLTASPRRSPAVSVSVWRWAAPSSVSRRSSSWTSRCRTSTPSSASRPVRRSRASSAVSASRPCTSRTTRSRP